MTSPFPSSDAGREDGAFGPYWRAVRHHPVLVISVVLATVLAALLWTALRTPTYESSATVLVTASSTDPVTQGLPIVTESNDPTRTLETAATILGNPKAAAVAAKELKDGTTPAQLLSTVNVAPQGDSNVLTITAKAATPQRAIDVANESAQAALSVRAETLEQKANAQIQAFEARRKALGNTDPTTSSNYASAIVLLEQIRDGQDPNFAPLQSATAAEATGPSKMVILVLSLLGGIVIGVGAALVLDQLERSVRDEEGLVESYPLPVLTRVPLTRDDRHGASPQVREAFRTLQVQLEDLGTGRGRVVMFTSASVGDGKTTSAIEMSKTLAASGLRVVLLDLDLRKPDVGGQLGVSSDVLTLFGSSPKLSDALVEAPGVPGLLVFSGRPSGGVTSMLEALFRQLPEMLAQAREISDVVVVDTAPLGRVSDALRVAAFADDLLFVARPGNTDRGDLRAARELLEHSGVTPTGMIVVGGASSSYGYYGEPVDLGVRRSSAPPSGPRSVRATEPVASSARQRKKRDSLS